MRLFCSLKSVWIASNYILKNFVVWVILNLEIIFIYLSNHVSNIYNEKSIIIFGQSFAIPALVQDTFQFHSVQKWDMSWIFRQISVSSEFFNDFTREIRWLLNSSEMMLPSDRNSRLDICQTMLWRPTFQVSTTKCIRTPCGKSAGQWMFLDLAWIIFMN